MVPGVTSTDSRKRLYVSSVRLKRPNKAALAYLAGIIDGEGHVALEKNQDRKVAIWNVPTIVVAMTHLPTIEACQRLVGFGSVHTKSNAGVLRRKSVYLWTVRWNQARLVARWVRPYAITKAAELDRIIALPIQRSGPARSFSGQRIGAIRRARQRGLTYAAIAERFGCGAMTAWKIVNGQMYGDVGKGN